VEFRVLGYYESGMLHGHVVPRNIWWRICEAA